MSDQGRSNGDAYGVLSYILAGLLLYGGLGFLADRWWGTRFLTPVGLILGLATSVYVIYKRYGRAT